MGGAKINGGDNICIYWRTEVKVWPLPAPQCRVMSSVSFAEEKMVIIEFQSEKAILLVIGINLNISISISPRVGLIPSERLTDLYMGSLARSLYQRMRTGESWVSE